MKRVISGFCCSAILFSCSTVALDIHEVYSVAKSDYKSGSDNNYLDFSMLSSSDFAKHKAKADRLSEMSLVESIKKCVFMQKGIYGDHLDDAQQDMMAKKLAKNIEAFSSYELASDELDMSTGLFNAPCILAVEDAMTGSVILLQGAAMD